jgi:hypothetical protein
VKFPQVMRTQIPLDLSPKLILAAAPHNYPIGMQPVARDVVSRVELNSVDLRILTSDFWLLSKDKSSNSMILQGCSAGVVSYMRLARQLLAVPAAATMNSLFNSWSLLCCNIVSLIHSLNWIDA